MSLIHGLRSLALALAFRLGLEGEPQLGVAVDLEVLDADRVLPLGELDRRSVLDGRVPRPVLEHRAPVDADV